MSQPLCKPSPLLTERISLHLAFLSASGLRSSARLTPLIPTGTRSSVRLALCMFGFPDAASPLAMSESIDERRLAFRASEFYFRVTDAAIAPAFP